ncbi:MAG: DUF2269 family protein [Gemmatimonadota bacterium]
MADAYLSWKALHIIGAVLMVGNVTVTGVWAILLWRHRDPATLKHMVRGILWTDLLFTFGGGAVMTIAGIMMVRAAALPWRDQPWLRHGIELLALSTLIWLVVLLPDQLRMERTDPGDMARFRRLFVRWSVAGWLATALLYLALWIMVTKPA